MAGYIPDTRQRIQKSTRFFARPESFALECPHCGEVYIIRRGQPSPAWEMSTARFTCSSKDGCGKRYVIGLLAWPIGPAPKVASGTPRDQVPSPRQIGMMRKEGGGWWLPEKDRITEKIPDETNLTLEGERPEREDDDE